MILVVQFLNKNKLTIFFVLFVIYGYNNLFAQNIEDNCLGDSQNDVKGEKNVSFMLYKYGLAKQFEFRLNYEKVGNIYFPKNNSIESINFYLLEKSTNEKIPILGVGVSYQILNFSRQSAFFRNQNDFKLLLQKFIKDDTHEFISFNLHFSVIKFKYQDKTYEFFFDNEYSFIRDSDKQRKPYPEFKKNDSSFPIWKVCNNCLIDTVIEKNKLAYDTVLYKRLKCGLYLNTKGDLCINNIKKLKYDCSMLILNPDSLIEGNLYFKNYSKYNKTKDEFEDQELKQVIDTNTFTFINDFYAYDKNHIYVIDLLKNTSVYILEDVDRNSFMISGNNRYAKDKNRIYYLNINVECKNIESFRVLLLANNYLLGFDGDNLYEDYYQMGDSNSEDLKPTLEFYLQDIPKCQWIRAIDIKKPILEALMGF